ncbi:MAG: sigma-54-dependent Fis family transcriptional regulator [Bryobacterales bacterium]|nr:sigma-54-dependent Fis family transcriptional regulator [Bryobacterales bacterium]
MASFSRTQRAFLEAVNRVALANPFLPDLAEAEQAALGAEYKDQGLTWSLQVDDPRKLRSNAWSLCARLEEMLPALRAAVLKGRAQLTAEEAALYEGAVLYALYHRIYPRMVESAFREAAQGRGRWSYYREFDRDRRDLLDWPEGGSLSQYSAPHMFALFYQLVRAFHWIFENIIGSSAPAARLRAAVWQSVFTHDLQRYRRSLHARMGDLVTLITGPSGTGKELVARAIALSRYVPFDERSLQFVDDPAAHFHPVNIAALSSALVESELFGHRRGSFTGALQDRKGWLEACAPLGAVFLDEIGELAPEIQVKLLRVIEGRSFTPVGDTVARRFVGKLLAATNRDLSKEIRDGRFREDLYYRLCSDLIRTPSLRQQIEESPVVLRDLVQFLAKRVAGEESPGVAAQALEWIQQHLPAGYPWPGNYRELEQCVRNVMVRRQYEPVRTAEAAEAGDLFAEARAASLSAEDLMRRYCTLVYARLGTYEAAAERLGLDRRTVKAKVDDGLLAKIRGGDVAS